VPRTRSGYVLVRRPEHPDANARGYVREHRLVMEQLCGRPLKHREVVHHRDGDRARNTRDNLVLFASQRDHLAYERHLRSGRRLIGEYLAPVETCYEPRRRRVYLPGDRRAA
jgi:hypothetical protein